MSYSTHGLTNYPIYFFTNLWTISIILTKKAEKPNQTKTCSDWLTNSWKVRNWEFVKHVVSITSISQYIVEKYYQYPANLWKRCFTPSAFSVCRHLSNYKFAAHSSTYVGCLWANWQSLWFCFLASLGRRQILLVPSS